VPADGAAGTYATHGHAGPGQAPAPAGAAPESVSQPQGHAPGVEGSQQHGGASGTARAEPPRASGAPTVASATAAVNHRRTIAFTEATLRPPSRGVNPGPHAG